MVKYVTKTPQEFTEVVMPGTVPDVPLLLKSIVERGESMFGSQEVISYADEGRTSMTYSELISRVRRLASGLASLGVGIGDRVASFAMNSREHLEMYYAVPSMGAVMHSLNVRLHEAELDYIINHAEDSVIVADAALLDKLPHLPEHVHLVVFGATSELPENAIDYETLIAEGDPTFPFPDIPESSASTLCYTSGTTAKPKGIVYTHRSTVLHSLLENQSDYYGIAEADVLLPIVPMFHANSWGLPYATMMSGGRIVLPGSITSAPKIAKIIADEKVTFAAAVPTVWQQIIELDDMPDITSLRLVIAGGAPLSDTFLKRFDALGIPVLQGWGMTEANPLLGVGRIPARVDPGEDSVAWRRAQGRPLPFVQLRFAPEDGELLIKGPTITGSYYKSPEETAARFTEDGFLRTGDVAEIDEHGVVRLVDRTKDMVKSGGEWIPSVDLENAIMSHPAVLEASVVGVPDERWGERPFAFVVRRGGATIEGDELREYLLERVAKWWLPDRFYFVDEVPKTSIGKFDKKVMRQEATGIIAGEVQS